jgi:hypothetical protein
MPHSGPPLADRLVQQCADTSDAEHTGFATKRSDNAIRLQPRRTGRRGEKYLLRAGICNSELVRKGVEIAPAIGCKPQRSTDSAARETAGGAPAAS